MKLTPASRALATIRVEAASSVGPPNIMVPRQIGEIFRPLRPRWRYCMGWVLFNIDRHCERSEAIHRRRVQTEEWIASSQALLAMTGRKRGFVPQSFFNILNTPLAITIQRLSTVTSLVTKI